MQGHTEINSAGYWWQLGFNVGSLNYRWTSKWWEGMKVVIQARPVPLVPKYVSYVAAGTLVQSVAANTLLHDGSVQSAVVVTSRLQCPISGCQYIITWQRCPISGCQRIAVTINKVSCQHNRLVQSAAASASSHDADNSASLESADHDECVSIWQDVSHDDADHSVFDVSSAIRNGCNVSTRQCYSENTVYNLLIQCCSHPVHVSVECGTDVSARHQPLSVAKSHTVNSALVTSTRILQCTGQSRTFTTAASVIMPHSAREMLPWYMWHHVRKHWCPLAQTIFFSADYCI